MVRAAVAAPGHADPAPADAGAVPDRYADLVAGWAADADLLLAERSRRRADGPIPVELPRRFGVSALVTMARDPALLAAQIRRPMPRGRSEERRVGKEGRSRWSPYHSKKKSVDK